YSCALQKEILVHGRLYVTQNYLCFYANIFGWETNVTLKWRDVASITKEKTALVIPNAVLISTKLEKYFFTSFVARDKTYLMLFRVWQNALMDQQMPAQEMWQWVHQCYGSELGLTSDDEDYIPPIVEDDKLSVRLSVESFSEKIIVNVFLQQECAAVTEGMLDHLIMENKLEEDGKMANHMGYKRNESDSHIPTDVTDNSESDAEKQIKIDNSFPFPREKSFSLKTPPTPDSDDYAPVWENSKSDVINVRCTCAHEGRQLMNEVVPIHIDQLFTLLFTSSKFYLDFHAARKTTDLTQTPWTHNPLDNSKSRVVNLTMALSQTMGPKVAQVTESQVMHPCSKAGYLYSIDIETINAGVPYADSFCVLIHYCLQKVSETHSSITVFGQIKYKKSVWGLVKGRFIIIKMIFFSHLTKALHVEGEENIPEMKRKSRRKRRLHSIPRCGLEDTRISEIIQENTAEESLNELQRSIHPSYASKVMSIIQNQQNQEDNKEEL
ncbi:hypothetical protein NQ314_013371, partial [Rhamnusium bicolor]